MSRRGIIVKNSSVGFLSQILSQIIQFIIRMITLRYIGIEVLGISATYSSILQTLSLTELGFQTAIVFLMYEPINNGDEVRLNKLITILHRVYTFMALIFIVFSILGIPFLKYILKDILITDEVILYYVMMSLNIAASYLFSDRRALLYADQKEYISKIIDCSIEICCGLIKICLLVIYANYSYFLLVQLLQTIVANLLIRKICKKKYKFVKNIEFDTKLFKQVFVSVKNVFIGKLAGYVYGATDNLIISVFLGTVKVGYLANYTGFIVAIKQVVGATFNAMTAIIGNSLVSDSDSQKSKNDFNIYIYLRYLLGSMVVIPWIIFADDAVKVLFGVKYILSDWIVILLGIDLYIHIIYTPCIEYINSQGFFSEDKNIGLIGTASNILFSLVLVKYMGIEGVLLGTVISQVILWFGRSYLVYFLVFKSSINEYITYILKNIVFIMIIIFQIIINISLINLFEGLVFFVALICRFIICIIINLTVHYFLYFRKMRER